MVSFQFNDTTMYTENIEISNLLFKKYTKILETGELFDTEILVGESPNNKIFRLHSFVLKVGSPYFRTAFSKNWKKVENNIIKFKKPNISVEVFDILIKYIYGYKLELKNYNFNTNVELLIAADELCLNNLCIFIEEYLLENKILLKQNFILIHDTTTKRPHFEKLSKFCVFTLTHDPSIIFKTNDFIKIKREFLLNIITKNNHLFNPIEIWDKVMEWAIAQLSEPSVVRKTSLKTLIHPFISFIDFKEINRKDFYQKVRPFKHIFDDKFYIRLIDHYAFNDIYIEI
ncbi:BTB/POZ protein [Rhizophagus diaphanus]|nr:BTB/POZ protein [Rhizophagus diaphanus] [Rhizophagus sp. MUCL 43196]